MLQKLWRRLMIAVAALLLFTLVAALSHTVSRESKIENRLGDEIKKLERSQQNSMKF